MRRAALVTAALLALAPAAAHAAVTPVQIQFQAFAPSATDVLPGDTVEWTNSSERDHTVTANDGTFDSGDLPGGAVFSRAFDAPGAYPYHCTIHLGMTGEIDVRSVILDPLPPAPVPAGESVEVTGRAADASRPVTIERDAGDGFRAVTTATPGPDGTWTAHVPAESTSDYRATNGTDPSQTRRLLVIDRHLTLTPTRRGVRVTVTPADPNARIVLEVLLRERFGWWPQTRKRLDYLSRADFAVPHRPARVRVSLVDDDGWTPLVTSDALVLRPRRSR